MFKHNLLLLSFLAVILSGCTVIKTVDRLVRPPKFDNNEYAAIVDIRTLSEQAQLCESSDDQKQLANSLLTKVEWARKYSEFIPRNEESFKMLTALHEETDRFVKKAQEGSSPTYCKLKLKNINEQSKTIQKALGDK